MTKRYIQIDTVYYDGWQEVIVARILNEKGQLDFNEDIEYFEKCSDREHWNQHCLVKPYKKDWCINKRTKELIEDRQTLVDIIEMHRKYDTEREYSTELLEQNTKRLEYIQGYLDLAFGLVEAQASHDPLYNRIIFYGERRNGYELNLSHEVGHLKLSKAYVGGKRLIIKTGLLEEHLPIERIEDTKEGHQLLFIDKMKIIKKVGEGVEESLNQSDTMAIGKYDSYYPNFGTILEKILEEKAQNARHNMDRSELVEALHKLVSSRDKAHSLLLMLDEYFKYYTYNDRINNEHELDLYTELSQYILAKAFQDKQRGVFQPDFVDNVLNWKIRYNKNAELLNKMEKELKLKLV